MGIGQWLGQLVLRGEIPRMAALLNHSWEAKKRTAGGISPSYSSPFT